MSKKLFRPLTGLMSLLIFLVPAHGYQARSLSGTVRDSGGAAVAGARVTLMNAGQVVIAVSDTDAQGRFDFPGPPRGHYVLAVSTRGFAERRVAVRIEDSPPQELAITLEPHSIAEEVTVTATPGLAENVERVPQEVNIVDEREID